MSGPPDDARREQLLRLMSAGLRPDGAAPAPIRRRPSGTVPPMTDEQTHIWLDAGQVPDAPLYNEPITIHYRGAYDHGLFLRSFTELLRRHEALRVSFGSLLDDPVQIIHDHIRADFPLIDVSAVPPADRERHALGIAREDAMRPFDLAAGPLFRGVMIRHGSRDHRLHLTLHHIIFDGVTIYRILLPELAQIHAAHMAGRAHDLPDPGIGYGDYAVWQRGQHNTARMRAQIGYWTERMAGAPATELPLDRPRPRIPTRAGSMTVFALDAPLVAQLRAIASDTGATLYMTLLAGMKALLFRYGECHDIVVGGVTDTRRRPEIQRMAGYCLNVLPLRTRVDDGMRFTALQARVRDTVVEALENSDVPFARIVREVRKREGTRRDLFSLFFSIEPPAPAFAEPWDLTQMDIPPQTAKYDLYVELDERPEGMAARILYSTELFDAETIDRMIGHWTGILRQVAADPDIRLDALQLMGAREADAVDAAGRGRVVAVPADTVPSLVRAAIHAQGPSVAIAHAGGTVSYRDLGRRIDALAHAIRAQGVRPGDVVGLCCDRSPDMIAGALAIMEAGAAYLPLDPSFPEARLAAIVADAAPSLIVTEAALAAALPPRDIATILCEEVGAASASVSCCTPGDLAYLIYTSGSTGVPKGVEIAHRSAVNLLLSMRDEPGCDASDVLLAVTTASFDISILEMMLPLVSGGTVVLAARADVVDPVRLATLVHTSGCTVMQGTPSLWRGLLAGGWAGRPGLTILCGGEALPADVAEALLARGMTLWNMYGPTETTIWSSVQRVTDRRAISIGRPIANTRMVVLDRDGRPRPFNLPGMLHIGGAGLARGYRDPALTRASFEDAAGDGERLYRTGDLAIMRRDGSFEWLGRRDGQVKIRGHRIDVGDIEAALARHPGVRAAAVRPFTEAGGGTALAACIETADDAPLDPADLRRHLRTLLPAAMIPGRFVRLDALPLTANGKIDRQALPVAPNDAAVARVIDNDPSGAWETALAAIWRELLGVEHVGGDDDFHDLGGHSLLAARMMGRIAATFGQRLPLSTLLVAPTLRTLAALIERQAPAFAAPRSIAIGEPRGGRTLYWIDAVPNLRPGLFRALAAALPTGLRLVGLTIDLRAHDELRATAALDQIATDLAQTLRGDPAAPPPLIGGWCNGGVLAYEVACQLADAGAPADLLVLLDSANPALYRSRRARVRRQIEQLGALNGRARWRFAGAIASGYAQRLRRRHRAPASEEDAIEALNARFMRLVNRYEPRPYAGAIALLQPRVGRIDYAGGWRAAVTGPLHVEDVPGGHVDVLQVPHVDGLAQAIARHAPA